MTSKIAVHNGCRVIEIDGKPFLPAAYRSFRPTPSNIALFHRAGIRLYQMLCSGRYNCLGIPYSNFGGIWKGHGEYDFSAFDRQMTMFRRFAPEGYFLVMIQLDMPDWWLKEKKDGPDSFNQLGEAVYCEDWVREAAEYLKAFIHYAEAKYGDRIYGYSFSAGSATEWFNMQNKISETKKNSYRAYLKNPGAQVPTHEEMAQKEKVQIFSPDNDIVKYLRYSSTLIPNLICFFAAEAQSVIRHNKLISVFFGYTDMPEGWQNLTDTNGYEKVWQSSDIDILSSPASYHHSRDLNGASSYQYLVDSVALNHKLYLHEIDHRTYLAGYPLDNFLTFENEAYSTEYETIMVLRRELCAAAVKDSALWWFDFTGNYYASPLLEKELLHEMNILNLLYQQPHSSVSEIAVFADPMSFLLLPDGTGVTMDYVRHNRDSLHECGAPYDYFNFKDITKINTAQYKMFVFLNAFEISDEIKLFIKERLDDKLKVWIHAPNYVNGNSTSPNGISDITGMEIAEFISDKTEEIVIDDNRFGFNKPMTPLFEVTDSTAEILGKYADTDKTAAALKNKNVYIGVGNVPATVWRKLATMAGVHIYCDTPGALYVDSRFVSRQTVFDESCTITMPFECETEELFDGGIYKTSNKILSYTAQKGTTKLFLIKNKRITT